MSLARRAAVLEEEDAGCLFRQRCPSAFARCVVEPELIAVGGSHFTRCWLVDGKNMSPATEIGTARKE
jgi:hypothetical protein